MLSVLVTSGGNGLLICTKMIDTIVLRFHKIGALEPHNRLAEWLNRTHTKTGKTITMTPAPDDVVPVSVQQLHRTTLHYHDTGNVQQVAHFNELKSSHYTIAYKIDIIKNFVEINLSIPKYIFGTNILLFSRPTSSKRYNHVTHTQVEPNLKEAFKRLYTFLNKFFMTEFGSIELYPTLIEVNRIDICYNQVFDAKEDALQYLAQLRKIKLKNARDTTNFSRGRHWKTSISYVTNRYSFKVYHKGAEFQKNDGPKLAKINDEGHHSFLFPVAYYQRFADRILRYEMTFRSSQINYLYMQNIFRADCHIWQHGKTLYNKFKQSKAKADTFMKFKRGLEPHEQDAINYYNDLAFKSKGYFLEVDSKSRRYDEETNLAKYEAHIRGTKSEVFDRRAPFGPELWDLMCGQFLERLDQFRLDVRTDDGTILAKAHAHNAIIISNRKKLDDLGISTKDARYKELGQTITISKLKIILKMLETQTFEEIADSNVFARSTWHRHRVMLKELGLVQTSQLSVAMRADVDLKSYQWEVLSNSSKFVNLSF
jgi:hypothetical protein